MKLSTRIFSCMMALLMVFSVLSVGLTAIAATSSTGFLEEIVLEPIARPRVTFTCTPITRVAKSANSMEPGTAIVKATPSGIPELSGSYTAQAYAGETPAATKIVFQSKTVGITPNKISCSNETVVLSDLVYNGAAGTFTCEVVSGTAEPGTAITFTIDYTWTDGNSYQEKCITFVEGIANGGSYAEAKCDIKAHLGMGKQYHVIAAANTRVLGTGVYYEQPSEIITNAEDPYRSYGVYNPATGAFTENVASGYNTSAFKDDKTEQPAGQMNMAAEFFVPGTTLAHVYVDSSVSETLADANIRIDINVGGLSSQNNSSPYTAIADTWVSPGVNVDSPITSNYVAAQAALGIAIPEKQDYGVKKFEINTSMTSVTPGVGSYQHLHTYALTGKVAYIVDGSSYTVTSKYYSYMYADDGLLKKFNMTSAPTVPTAMTFHIVDKGALRELIDYVMNSDPTTPSTRTQQKGANPQAWFYRSGFSQFQTAYVEALRVLNNPKATQSEIDAATKSLQTMYNNLQLKTADYKKVDALNDAADEILDKEEAYALSDIALIREAQEMVTKSYSILYQSAVDQMAENLDKAIKNATPLPGDYEAVYAAKNEFDALDKNAYTTESWQAVQDAINAVDYTKNALEQDEVDDMAQAIRDAIDNLEIIKADFAALETKLTEAKAIDISVYINGDLLVAPIENAEAAIADNAVKSWSKARQAEVDALTKNLDDSIKALILKSAYKDALKAAIDAEIPGNHEYYNQTILAEYKALVAEGTEMYYDSTLTVYDQGKIDAKETAITEKYAELMASYDDSCRHTSVDAAVKENQSAPTCTEDGSYDTVVYCTVCDEELSRETTVVEALGHTEGEAVEENRVEATYEQPGSYDTVVYCTVCGEELSRETTVIPMLDGYFREAEGSTTVIDTELGFIYGLDIGLSDLEGFVEYSSSVTYETPDGIGTGMALTTYRDGEEWETYTIIIFGDLNGDGVIDIYDASILAAIVNGDMELEEGDAILFAADLNGDTAVDIYDLAILNAVVNGETEIGQVPMV